LKIAVTIIAHGNGVGACALLEADVEWLALDVRDIDKMKDFKVGGIHQIEIYHDNGSFLWPAPVYDK